MHYNYNSRDGKHSIQICLSITVNAQLLIAYKKLLKNNSTDIKYASLRQHLIVKNVFCKPPVTVIC